MREPAFWWRESGVASALLAPFAAVYGRIAAQRMERPGARASVPVICVGNFTLGGSGKTPATIAIAKLLQAAGERPFCLSRGYGGSNAGPLQVDAEKHSAGEVGDEALLLARAAPTIIAHRRVAGASAAHAAGASVIVMDDGLQNPSLAKDFTIAAVDARRGIGNGKIFPAGPLRAPLDVQLAHTDALLVTGEGDGASEIAGMAQVRKLPVWHGRIEPERDAIAALKGKKVLAFAGIGDPEKIFATVAAAGIDAPIRRAFPDHHRYSGEEAGALLMQAERDGLELLTTEKDIARMSGDPVLSALAARARALPVTLAIQEDGELRRLLLKKIRK